MASEVHLSLLNTEQRISCSVNLQIPPGSSLVVSRAPKTQSSVVCRSIPENKARDSIKAPSFSDSASTSALRSKSLYSVKHLLFPSPSNRAQNLDGGGCPGPHPGASTQQRASNWGRPAPLGPLGGGSRVQGAEASGALARSDWFSCPRDSKALALSASEPGGRSVWD